MKRAIVLWEVIKESLEWDGLKRSEKFAWVLILLCVMVPMLIEAKLSKWIPEP